MKIDRRKIAIRCGYDEPECKALADRLAAIKDDDRLIQEISKIRVWTYGKCELGLWADILDRFDSILEEAVKVQSGSKWTLNLDSPDGTHLVNCVIKTLEFTGHLIEHSIYRYMYGSLDHVIRLFNSSNMDVVLSVLGLFYTFSKRSNYFARLENSKKHEVASRLEVLAESWGGKENNFGLRECCSQTECPKSASTLHFEYYDESNEAGADGSTDDGSSTQGAQSSLLRTIHLEKLHLSDASPDQLMEEILKSHKIPESKQVAVFARLRLARYFSTKTLRTQCLKARLQAISILCYNFDAESRILYRELMEELVDVLQLPDDEYRDMKASVMRTLTAIVHSGKRYYTLESMMETTGMNSYPGVVPSMVHRCVQDLVEGRMEAPSGSVNQQFTTALLSFLYHLACFEEQETYPVSTGGAYRSSLATGYLIDSMLRLISWRMPRTDYLTFATRAVRVTDQILNGTGQQHRMPILSALVGRLHHEVQANPVGQYAILSRSALMKSIINLIKRIIAESDWSTAVTTMMENSRIPDVVLTIIKRPNDFPAPLYLNSLELITNYIYQNPSRLSSLQEKGLTKQIIDVLREHPLPVSREVLISLAQVLSMMVLNDAGALAIIKSGIIEKFLNCLVDEAYLPAMKLRRMRDNSGQTSTPHQMGYTLDELIRCHNMMRMPCVTAMVAVLQALLDKGTQLSEDISVHVKERTPEMATELTERRKQFMEITFNVLKFFESFLNTHGSQQMMPDLLREHVLPLLLSLIQLPCLPIDFHSTPAGGLVGVFMRSLATVGSQSNGGSSENPQTESGTEIVWNKIFSTMIEILERVEPILHEESYNELLNQTDTNVSQWPPKSHLVDDYVSLDGESELVRHLSVFATLLSIVHSTSSQVNRDQRLILVRLWHGERGSQLCAKLRSLMNSLTLELGMLVHYLLDKSQRENHQAWIAIKEVHAALPSSTVIIKPVSGQQVSGDQSRSNSSSVGEDLRQPILTSEPGPERLALFIASSLMSDGLHMLFAIFRSFFPLQSEEVIVRYGDKNTHVSPVSPEERVLAHMIRLCGRTLHLASNVCAGLSRLAVGNLNFATFRRRQTNAANPPVDQCNSCAGHLGSLLFKSLGFRLPYRIPKTSSSHQQMETDSPSEQQPGSFNADSTSDVVPMKLDSWERQLQLKLNFTLSFFSLRLVTLLLCEQSKVPYHILLNAFQVSHGHDALFNIFHDLFGNQWEEWCALEERTDMKLMGMQFLERWLICVERFTNTDFISSENQSSGSGVFDDITRCPAFKADKFLKHTHSHFLSVLKILFKTPPSQTLSLLTPKAQECLVTIMLHMANRARKNRGSTSTTKTDMPVSRPAIAPGSLVTATANSLAAALQSASGVMANSGNVLGSGNEQLRAAMEAVVTATRQSVDVAQSSNTSESNPAPDNNRLQSNASNSEFADAELERQDDAPAGQSERSEERQINFTDELAQLMDMFPRVPRELIISSLEESRGNVQEATETLLLTSSISNSLSPRNETIPSPPPPPLVPPPLSSDASEALSRAEVENVTLEQLVEFLPSCLRLTRGKASKQICLLISELYCILGQDESLLKQIFSDLVSSETPQASYNYFVALQFTRNRFTALELACSYSIPRKMINVLEKSTKGADTKTVSNQITSACLIMDQVERTQSALAVRRDAIRLLLGCREWRMIDEKTIRWQSISNNANRSVAAAFHDGIIHHRFIESRRQELVNFVTMTRMTHSSLTRRPFQPWSPILSEVDVETSNSSTIIEPTAYEQKLIDSPELSGFNQSSRDTLFQLLVSFILNRSASCEWKSLDAVLRLLLRLTSKDYNYASQLADLNVYENLLTAQIETEYAEYSNIVALLLRQIFEDPVMIEDCITDILRHAVRIGLESKGSDVQMVYKPSYQFDMLYLIFQLGPLFARDFDTTVRLATEKLSLQIDSTWVDDAASDKSVDIMKSKFVLRNQLQDDPKTPRSEANTTGGVSTPGSGQTPTPTTTTASSNPKQKPTLSDRQKGVLRWLLDHLLKPDTSNDMGIKTTNEPPEGQGEAPAERIIPDSEELSSCTDADEAQGTPVEESIPADSEMGMDTSEPDSVPRLMETTDGDGNINPVGEQKRTENGNHTTGSPRRQLGKGEFFLFLTELIRSYSPVADFVVTYQCNAEISEYHGCALACLIDRYLIDTRFSELTGNLIGWLVRSVHSPEAQSITVSEIKAALRRALAMVECRRKHELLQGIAKLLDKIVAPLLTHAMSVYNNVNSHLSGRSDIGAHNASNLLLTSVLRTLYKKQIGRDLAKVPVALDMNSPRATETTVRVVKTLETLTRINKINTLNSVSNNTSNHRRRHPAQHYHTHLRADANVQFRTVIPSRRARALVRQATVESIDSAMESGGAIGDRRHENGDVDDIIFPILDGFTQGEPGDNENISSNRNSSTSRSNANENHSQDSQVNLALQISSLEVDGNATSNSVSETVNERRHDESDIVESERGLVNPIDDEDEDIMVDGGVAVSIFAREQVDDDTSDHVMLEADDDVGPPQVSAFDDPEDEDDDVEDDDVEDVHDDVAVAEGDEVEDDEVDEDDDDDSDSESSDDEGRSGDEPGDRYRTGDGDDDDEDFDEDDNDELGAEGLVFQVPMQVSNIGGEVVFPGETSGTFAFGTSSSGRHYRSSSIMEPAEIRNLLEDADLSTGSQRNGVDGANLSMERVLDLLNTEQRLVDNIQRQNIFVPQYHLIGGNSSGNVPSNFNFSRSASEGTNQQQSTNRTPVHHYTAINSQHESLRHTSDIGTASGGTSGTAVGGVSGSSSTANNTRNTGGFTASTVYRWPNRGFSQILPGGSYDSFSGGAFQISGRVNQQDTNNEPMAAQEGDVAMWEYLKELEAVTGGSITVSNLERPTLPPLSYRRWIELARVLYGREISDLVIIAREKVAPSLIKKRKNEFEKSVNEKKLEKQKEKNRLLQEKENEEKRQLEVSTKLANLSQQDEQATGWNSISPNGQLTENQKLILKRQVDLLSEIGNLRERPGARHSLSIDERHNLRDRLRREVDPFFMRTLAICFLPITDAENRRTSTGLLQSAYRVMRVVLRKISVDSTLMKKLDESIFTMGIMTDTSDFKLPEDLDLSTSNIKMLLHPPNDVDNPELESEGLSAVLRLLSHQFEPSDMEKTEEEHSNTQSNVQETTESTTETTANVDDIPESQSSETANESPSNASQSEVSTSTKTTNEATTGETVASANTEGSNEESRVENDQTEENTQDTEQAVSLTGASAAENAEGNTEGLLHQVDPSFLSALPEDLRREVIADEVRTGLRQHMASRASGETPVISEQFLSALPEHIQEEVNAQFRRVTANMTQSAPQELSTSNLESESNADAPGISGAITASGSSNTPNEGQVQPLTRNESATFLDTLSPELRRDVLTDMDDSQIAALPQAVANEARQLRMENEQRTVRMYQERAYHQAMTAHRFLPTTRVLHASDFDGFRHITRQMRNLFPSMIVQSPRQFGSNIVRKNSREPLVLKCKQFVDQEGLTCLLSLLIRGYTPTVSIGPGYNQPVSSNSPGPVRQMLLCTSVRRLLKNLAYHIPTRYWLLRALLSILHAAAAATSTFIVNNEHSSKAIEQGDVAEDVETPMEIEFPLNSLLNMSYPVALGCRVPFFAVTPSKRKSGDDIEAVEKEKVTTDSADKYEVLIHPRVAAFVCKTMLDTLADMGQCFYEPLYPKSSPEANEGNSSTKKMDIDSVNHNRDTPECDNRSMLDNLSHLAPPTEFWRLLLLLERTSVTSPVGPTSGTNVSGTSCSPMKTIETSGNQSTAPECAFVYVASLLLHDGLYRRQELLETTLKLLDEILNKYKQHVDSKRLTTGATSGISARQTTQSGRQGENPLYNWLLTPDQMTGNQQSANRDPDNSDSRQDSQDANEQQQQQETSSSQTSQRTNAELPTSSATKASVPDGMEVLPERLIKRIAEVLLYSPINEWAMRHALSLVKTISRLNSKNRANLCKYLMEGLVSLAGQLTADLEKLSTDLINDNEKRKKESEEQLASESEAMDTSSPSSVVASTSREAESNDNSRTASTAATRVINRFQNGETVVIVGDRRPQALTSDLQLASLVPFTTKGSTQHRFVKILTLINTIRPEDSDSKSEGAASLLSHIPVERKVEMDKLWDKLSKTLTLLEDSADPQAVLLLQPSVEAFFLSHAKPKSSSPSRQAQQQYSSNSRSQTGTSSGSTTNESSRQNDQLAHLNLEVGPVSPLPMADGSTTADAGASSSSLETKSGTILQQPLSKGVMKDPLFRFAEKHRTVLNQILRQQTNALVDGPFSQLINHPKVLDFDVKRNYIHTILAAEHSNSSQPRDEEIVQVNRARVFEDSFARLHRKSAAEWKNKFYIIFAGEEGQDAGGLLREWYQILARETFNPNYALFCHSAGDNNVYSINPASYINSNHLTYFKFVGRVMAKAIYDQQLLECYFTRSFYKHILGIPVKCSDMENEDNNYHKSLVYMLENDVTQLDLTFTTEVNEFGRSEVRELVDNGSQIKVNDLNKSDYVRLLCQEKMTGAIRQQLNAFLEGFYDIIPKSLISIFNEQELELLISGLPNIDVDDLMANTEYNKYTSNSMEIQWFWRALRSFEQEDRARFLQFVTGTSKVPLGGFSNLHVMHGPQKFQIHKDTRGTDRLPTAHTCFNQLDLPPYETYDKLKNMLLTAIRECSEGFGFA